MTTSKNPTDTWPHCAAAPVDRLLADCELTRTRRSGPGGQHRNKVETTIVIRHRPTGIIAEAGERRSQEQNRKEAIFRLRRKLAINHRTTVDPDRGTTTLLRSRLRKGRIELNPEHADYPSILAEILDILAAVDQNVASAADRIGCSTTQLVKLLKTAPPSLDRVNQRRRTEGLKPLR